MEATTYQEVQGLSRMTVGELREKHLDVFGEETHSYHKEVLRKRIAWRLQALAEGDLSERALPLPPRPGSGKYLWAGLLGMGIR
jgi:hypothetical protein